MTAGEVCLFIDIAHALLCVVLLPSTYRQHAAQVTASAHHQVAPDIAYPASNASHFPVCSTMLLTSCFESVLISRLVPLYVLYSVCRPPVGPQDIKTYR